MVVRTNLYPVARGAASKKSGKKPMTFIASFYGIVDKDGFYAETTAVDCWMPGDIADVLKAGQPIDGVLDVNGEMTILKEFTYEGARYIVSGNKEAEVLELPFPVDEKKK